MGSEYLEFLSSRELLSKVASAYEEDPGRVAYLVGAPLTTECGVPDVRGMIRLVIDELKDSSFIDNTAQDSQVYQAAFGRLLEMKPRTSMDRIIRKAVLAARLDTHNPELVEALNVGNPYICNKLDRHPANWRLEGGVLYLGQILARFEGVVLTTNFDPLLEISVKAKDNRASCSRTVLTLDGDLTQTEVAGTNVVHLHGYWCGSDTLHTPNQLGYPRTKLTSSLKTLLKSKLLVVTGYGGWDDVFTRALEQLLDESGDYEVLWTFYEKDEAAIRKNFESLLRVLTKDAPRRRIAVYKNIDLHQFFKELYDRISRLPRSDRAFDRSLSQPQAKSLVPLASDHRPIPLDAGTAFGLDCGSFILIVAGFDGDGVLEALTSASSRMAGAIREISMDVVPREWDPIDTQTISDQEAISKGVCDKGAAYFEHVPLAAGSPLRRSLLKTIESIFRKIISPQQIAVVVHVIGNTVDLAAAECADLERAIGALQLGIPVHAMRVAFRPKQRRFPEAAGFSRPSPSSDKPLGSHFLNWYAEGVSKATAEDRVRFEPVLGIAADLEARGTTAASSATLSLPREVARELPILASPTSEDLYRNFLQYVDCFLPECIGPLLRAMAELDCSKAKREALLFAARSDDLMDEWVMGANLAPDVFERDIGFDADTHYGSFIETLTLALLRLRSQGVNHAGAQELLDRLLPFLSESLIRIHRHCYSTVDENGRSFGSVADDLLATRAGIAIETTPEMLAGIDTADPWFLVRACPASRNQIKQFLALPLPSRAVFGLCTATEWAQVANDPQVVAKIMRCRNTASSSQPGERPSGFRLQVKAGRYAR